MSGRGRGVSNAPAWMTRGGGDNIGPPPPGGGGGGPPPYPADPPQQHDDFGRAPRGGGGGGDDYHHRDHRDRGREFRDRGPPPPHWRDRDRDRDRRDRGRGSSSEGGRRRGGSSSSTAAPASSASVHFIPFRNFDEEKDWVEDRRRKRKARQAVESKFDKAPTAQQLQEEAAMGALVNPAATDFSGIQAGSRDFAAVPQQTRHARRLYVGQLPPGVTEQELHDFFRQCIATALVDSEGKKLELREDPILSVYINHERRFCFLEFRTVEMATSCLELDGVDIHGRGKVKVKRPNDYNPAMAPQIHPSALPHLDVSKLGIVSGTVNDGPNKIFIGGELERKYITRQALFCCRTADCEYFPHIFYLCVLCYRFILQNFQHPGLHYHLTEPQIMTLLEAFGKVKAFHLVKNDPDSMTSKGYCFVEYSDPAVTPIAVQGLNGMDLGGGKMLTARVAAQRGPAGAMPGVSVVPGAPPPVANGNAPLPPAVNIVAGYNVEELVDAAMGLKPMPTAPTYLDSFGLPLTRIATVVMPVIPMIPQIQVPIQPVITAPTGALPPGSSALDIANAALSAFAGGIPIPVSKTKILVLSNMVTDEDLATDEDYNGLKEEVEEEVRKFGKLVSMAIPRPNDPGAQPSAIRKIFLEYATVQDAINAERELSGRQFGPLVVETGFFDEQEFAARRLK